MAKVTQPFTLGIWIAKPGSEAALISEWSTFAKWTARTYPEAGHAVLLQDRDHPEQFVSVGPWNNPEAIKAWRESREFKASVDKLRTHCESFQPRSLVLVASSND